MAGERARVTTLGAREASVLALAPLERAQAIAAHESPRTTKLYDRTADETFRHRRGYREDRDLRGFSGQAQRPRHGTRWRPMPPHKADQCHRGAELTDRTRHRLAR